MAIQTIDQDFTENFNYSKYVAFLKINIRIKKIQGFQIRKKLNQLHEQTYKLTQELINLGKTLLMASENRPKDGKKCNHNFEKLKKFKGLFCPSSVSSKSIKCSLHCSETSISLLLADKCCRSGTCLLEYRFRVKNFGGQS